MAEFRSHGKEKLRESRSNEFRDTKVPSPGQIKKSKFWTLAMEVANGYKGKINPKTKKKYTKEERIEIGVRTAGKVAARKKKTKK